MTSAMKFFGAMLLILGAGSAPPSHGAERDAGSDVSCQLPPQIRRLGRSTTYLAAGRIVQTSAADCRVRGGQVRGAVAVATAPPPAAGGAGMAVMVGGDKKADACPVSGEIVGLRVGSTLSVRAGPSTAQARVDKLGNGRTVFVCDGTPDEAWLGVVYPAQAGQDCGVSKPIRDAAAYAGPCRVGWVNAGWVRTH